MLSGLLHLLSRQCVAKCSNTTFLLAPQRSLISWTKFDLMNVPNYFQLQARCGPLVTIFAESMLLKAPRSASGDCAVGGCSNRR